MQGSSSLIDRLGKFKNFFISPRLIVDEETYRKASVLTWVSLGIIMLCVVVTAADVAVGNTKFVPVFFVLLTVLGLILTGLRIGGNPAVLGNALMVVCFSAICYSMLQRGGILSAQVVFLVLIPALMVTISGIRSSMFWALAACVAIVVVVLNQWDGNELTFTVDSEYFSNSMANYVSAVLFVSIMFIYTEYSRMKARQGMLIEQKRSDDLLLNILPEAVAHDLKNSGRYVAQQYDSVTVLFTDFSGFTAISEQLEPQELVSELDQCFTAFDEICKRNRLEKIKTIGDAYMAVSGLPNYDENHAVNAVKAAMEMRDWIDSMPPLAISTDDGPQRFSIRIGLNSGSVVAGIVGSSKFQYDIWGDTVNTASRMESSGVIGEINTSATTYELIKEEFSCEFRGEIEAKGKGKVKMYLVKKGNDN